MVELNTLATKLQSLHSDVSDIKGALNELTRAINKLAVIEERQAVTTASIERAFTAIAKVEERLLELEKLAPENHRIGAWVDRAVMAVVGAALMMIWDKLKG
jgi:chaperonin cofactor prefoldin